ncbi:MAG: mannitol dehydrogenase family protein [Pseudonocardia sp.]|nr:mannitol dehydrogenase family protein [Pseudonocardia sp.]
MSPSPTTRRLNRGRDGRPAAPVRIAHLGTGNFFRAHQAWYTEHAPDAADWGIAAFSGHGGSTAARLADQDGLYTLVVRAADGDRAETVAALSRVRTSLADWRRVFAAPELALVTMTVTEAGYRRDRGGGLDRHDAEVGADIAALRSSGPDADVTTAPGKLAVGLAVRRELGLPAPALVCCDNVPDNAAMVARVVGELAAAADPGLATWIEEYVSFVTTMVDRITPRATDDDRCRLRAATGVDDPVPVITEPYTEWVLAGRFPLGRPRWEDVGARFVDDVEPWERRKLWLLNGSHSLLAYAGGARGHRTVHEAISDPVVRAWVQRWWDDAARHLPLPDAEVAAYRAALAQRFANPRIRHQLAQIAADGSQKIPIRILPVVRAELADGRVAAGAARVLAGWICHLRGCGVGVTDVAADEFTALAAGELGPAVRRVLARLDVADDRLLDAVTAGAREHGG